ncbi:MAG TPA: hypothetical protein VFE51_01460 [Verrucomicrobiae bacterium]|nr:hypothetical protein [Verrucomicrobiae bacterium]
MNKSPGTTVLLVILVASALASVVFCGLYISSARQLREVQFKAAVAQNDRILILSLGKDVLEYSKKNPAIDPLLQSTGFKPNSSPAPASTNRSGGK